MSYVRKVAYNTVIQIIGRLLTSVVALGTVALLNRMLLPEGWGHYVTVTSYLAIVAVFSDFGLNTLLLRQLSKYPEKTDELLSDFLGARLVTAAILIGVGVCIGLVVPTYTGLRLAIFIAGLSQFLLVVNQMLVSVVQAKMLMDRAVLADIFGRAFTLGLVVVLLRIAPPELRLYYALWALVAGSLLNVIMSLFFVSRLHPLRVSFRPRQWKGILIQALPLSILAILGAIHFRIDIVMLSAYKDAVQVGIYGNAYKLIELTLILPGVFVGSLVPRITKEFQAGNDDYQRFLQKSFDVLAFTVVPVITGLFIAAPILIGLLADQHVVESTVSMRILLFALLPFFFSYLTGNVLIAAHDHTALNVIEFFAAVLNIALNMYAIQTYGIYGAAAVTVISSAAVLALSVWRVRVRLGVLPSMRVLWGSLCISLLLTGGIYYLFGGMLNAHSPEAALLPTVGILAVYACCFLGLSQMLRVTPEVILNRLRVKLKN